MKTVEMPKMGDTMEEGKILRWIKKEGEQVKRANPWRKLRLTKSVLKSIPSPVAYCAKSLSRKEHPLRLVRASRFVGSADEPLPENVVVRSAQATQPR